jgi:uncharacterized membrane protein YeaQ/YmgE (transglycosylase-associated protein family)
VQQQRELLDPIGEYENMHILWIILIGFIAGVIAKLVTPGDNEPRGFILTTILGIVGAFVATYLPESPHLLRRKW